MPEDFKEQLKEELYKACRPVISGMVRRWLIQCTNNYNSLGPELDEETKRATVLVSVKNMAAQIREITGEEE